MINLGNNELNQLPEATKEKICEVIYNYFHSPSRLEISPTILLSHYADNLEIVLAQLNRWQIICHQNPKLASRLVNKLDLKLIRLAKSTPTLTIKAPA